MTVVDQVIKRRERPNLFIKPILLSVLVCSAAVLSACGQSEAGEAQRSPRSGAAQVIASPTHPVVVELFQSQGCSSCPPANANLNAIADRPDILALSFAVTYWDQLGWKDTFGSPQWTARQWDYAKAAGRSQVGTPQVVINGSTSIVGINRHQLAAAIAKAGPARGGPELSASGARLRIGPGNSGVPYAIWLVRYDPRALEVPVRAGENGGRTLPHRDIVRELVKLGTWNGAVATFIIPAGTRSIATAILVQRGAGGPITAALKI